VTGSAGPDPAHFESLFQQAPCGYLVTDDDGRITAVNETFVRWTGYSRPQLIGSKLQSLMPVGDQILYSTHCIPQLGINGAVSEIAVEIIDADGGRRAALLSASAPTNAGYTKGNW
jgi:diguanylate cyclase